MSEKVRRGKENWRKLLEEQAESGLSVTKFCELRKLSSVTFYNWRQRLKDESQSGKLSSQVASRGRPSKSKLANQDGLIELIVDGKHVSGSSQPPVDSRRLVEVSLAGGVMVRIHGDISPAAIGQLVASIRDSDQVGGR
jgi:hypothetical protein